MCVCLCVSKSCDKLNNLDKIVTDICLDHMNLYKMCVLVDQYMKYIFCLPKKQAQINGRVLHYIYKGRGCA